MLHKGRFKPHHHVPKFSFVILETIFTTPLLGYLAFCGNVLTFSSAYVFYRFEVEVNETVTTYWDAAWWALCTVSTVGYGDIVPVTNAGRGVGAFLIIVGVTFFVGFMAVLVSVISSVIAEEIK